MEAYAHIYDDYDGDETMDEDGGGEGESEGVSITSCRNYIAAPTGGVEMESLERRCKLVKSICIMIVFTVSLLPVLLLCTVNYVSSLVFCSIMTVTMDGKARKKTGWLVFGVLS